MTPEPTLTDEELRRHKDRSWLGIPMTPVATRRLIAALRASREREKITEESLTQLRTIIDAVEDDLGMDYINALIERS